MIESLLDPVFKAHRMFVADIKEAARKAHGSIPDPGIISPRTLGKRPLSFPMPPMMEEVFGYRGSLRFVEFSYSSRTHDFGCSDGGDRLLTDANLWLEFVKHPWVARELGEIRYPSLYGRFERGVSQRAYPELKGLATQPKGKHCLMLDRWERRAYVFEWSEAILFFPLTEPEEGDDHMVWNGKLVSRGCEDTGRIAPIEVVAGFRNWLNAGRWESA
jgi:hypothetical protein